MKKWIAFALVLLLLLAVPVSAENHYVHDDEGLLQSHDVVKLEEVYSEFSSQNDFDVALATVDSFGGLSAENFAKELYEVYGYSENAMLYLVSLTEGEWYILLKGECAGRLSDRDASQIGEELVELLRDGQYYAAFLAFPEKALEVYLENAPVIEDTYEYTDEELEDLTLFDYFIAFGGWGFLVAAVVVIIMLVKMKSVGKKYAASDYIIPGSARVTVSRDIFLYANTTRTRREESSSSSSSGGSSGRSTGGAGGKI